MPKHTKEQEESIREVLAELKSSGESVAAFARRRGLSAWTLYDWRRRFSPTGTKPMSRRGRRASRRHGRPGLVAVKLTDPIRREHAFELTIGSTTVTVPHGFDEEELARLLKVLSSC